MNGCIREPTSDHLQRHNLDFRRVTTVAVMVEALMEQATACPADTHDPEFRMMANELCRPGLAEVSGAIRREASGAIRHEARSAIWRKASGAGALWQEVGGALLTRPG